GVRVATLYNNDLDSTALDSRHVCVLGFGAQGRAQALNLRDSGVNVIVGLRNESSRRDAALAEGLTVLSPEDAAAQADVLVMLVPDTVQPDVYHALEPAIRPGTCLVFAHGYAIRYGKISPRGDIDVVMVAPMGIGEQVREVYRRGAGVPGLIAVEQDATGNARTIAEAYARANGHGH